MAKTWHIFSVPLLLHLSLVEYNILVFIVVIPLTYLSVCYLSLVPDLAQSVMM